MIADFPRPPSAGFSSPKLPAPSLSLLGLFFTVLAAGLISSIKAEEEKAQPLDEQRQKILRLQIFLDNRDFNPGIIDGRWGEFTRKALRAYFKTQGKEQEFGDEPPEHLDVPLDEISPVTTTYKIVEADRSMVGQVPDSPQAQAKKDALPYESLAELVAEKYHADQELLRTLNPNLDLDKLKPGDSVTVPNIDEIFSLPEVKEASESAEAEKESTKDGGEEPPQAPAATIHISTAEKTLELAKQNKTIAFYPITPGSENLPAPEGEWKITSITYMPWFRYDKKMLEEGERSDEAYDIPPGPNNAVGIVWMALNKEGIGIHGTGAPETIGRSQSHGCIRLSNWDAWNLSQRVTPNTKVIIK